MPKNKPGLYSNIHAKKKRISSGSGERMRKVNTKGSPSEAAFRKAALSSIRKKGL
jgi:hypothetical protein